MIDDEKEKAYEGFNLEIFTNCNHKDDYGSLSDMDGLYMVCGKEAFQDAPQEKHWSELDRDRLFKTWKALKCADVTQESFDSFLSKWSNTHTQPTSETYDQGVYIIVQDGDGYIAHIYFTSEQEWEIEETLHTYLAR